MNVEKSTGVTSGVRNTPNVPRQRTGSLLDHAVRYAEQRHGDVVPGTWLRTVDGTLYCSCGDAECGAPGAHPADRRRVSDATGSVSAARRMWEERPQDAEELLPALAYACGREAATAPPQT